MGKIAFIFPGQGAQTPGMGTALYSNSPAARAVLDLAERIRPGTLSQCFYGSEEELKQTVNTQPCLYCAELAAAAALYEKGVYPDMLAGFSLGELTALAFSGAVSYEDGFKIVIRRAELMQQAAETADAGMIAVLKLSDAYVIKICAEFDNAYPVNFNCPGQVVVSCAESEIEALKARIKEEGGRAMPLKVGGGFHSPFMDGAADEFANALGGFSIGTPNIPLYSNVTAARYQGDAATLMTRQINSPVLWRAEVETMITDGADTFIEAGPGKTLAGLLARISEDVRVYNVGDMESLEKTVAEVRRDA